MININTIGRASGSRHGKQVTYTYRVFLRVMQFKKKLQQTYVSIKNSLYLKERSLAYVLKMISGIGLPKAVFRYCHSTSALSPFFGF